MNSLERAERVLLIALILFMPISASPLLPFDSGTLVRPLSIVPAAALLFFMSVRVLIFNQRCRPELRDGMGPLLIFVAYVVLSGLGVIAVEPDDVFKGQTPFGSFARAVATLGAGISFYVVGRCYIRSVSDIKLVLRWLTVGLSASILLAVLQVAAIVQRGDLLRLIQAVTDVFAVHYDGLATRAQGMTFEPSWLATQIIVLLMPMLIARCISRQRFVRSPPGPGEIWRTLPGFCMALIGLLCAGSRFGLVAASALISLSVLLAAFRGKIAATLAQLFMIVAAVAGIGAMGNLQSGAGANYVLGPVAFLENGPDAPTPQAAPEEIVEVLALAGRIAAAQSAASVWLANPLTGVSLGNDYRYFPANAPDWAFGTALFQQNAREGLGWIDRYSPEKGNAKNLILRLLAETGVAGLVLFGAFFVRQTLWIRATDPYFGYFRLTTVAAVLFSAFNQDSFADPMLWIPLVLCCAMGRLQETNTEPGKTGFRLPTTAASGNR